MYDGLRVSKQVSERDKYLLRVLLYPEFVICLNFVLLLFLLFFHQCLINVVALLEKYKREILDQCANDSSCDAMTRLVFGKSP